jgi:hypothetical protein
MAQPTIHAELSPSEGRLLLAIREIPEGNLRERALEVMGELVFFVGQARCQGMGVEGFPCGEPRSSCEACQEVWDVLDRLASQVARA